MAQPKNPRVRVTMDMELEGAGSEAVQETRDLFAGKTELFDGEQWLSLEELLANWLLLALPDEVEGLDLTFRVGGIKITLPKIDLPGPGGPPTTIAPGAPGVGKPQYSGSGQSGVQSGPYAGGASAKRLPRRPRRN